VPIAIDELLAGKGLSIALGSAMQVVRWARADAKQRLLLLLHHDFGDETELGADSFYGWKVKPELDAAIMRLLTGEESDMPETRAELAALIAPRLVRTPEEGRSELAGRIALAAFKAARLVLREPDDMDRYLMGALERQVEAVGQLNEKVDIIRDAVTGSGTGREAAQALVVGPLRQAGVEADARDAAGLAAEGEHAEAAEKFIRVASQLSDQGLSELAEGFVVQAAEALRAEGRSDEAAGLLVEAAWARLDRGQPTSALMLLPSLDEADEWLVEAIRAEVDWPELGELAVQMLSEGIRRTDAMRHRVRWLATLTTVLALWSDWEGVLEETKDYEVDFRDGDDALTVRCNTLLARERVQGFEAVRDDWSELELWADTAASDSEGATVWATRGVSLAVHGMTEEAIAAYRRSMAAWAREAGAQEQVAEQLFNLQTAALLNGLEPPDLDLRPLASVLRSPQALPVNVADRLAQLGTSELIDGDFPDALRLLAHALAFHHRSGSLQGLQSLTPKLASVFEQTGRPALALAFSLRAGDAAAAKRVAAQVPGQTLGEVLETSGSVWERAATWSVVAQEGARLPTSWLREHVSALIVDARTPVDSIMLTPATSARPALAAVLCGLDDSDLPDALQLVRDELTGGFVGTQRATADALIRLTNTGRSDETELLAVEMLTPNSAAGISPHWVGDQLGRRPDLRARLLEAAAGGSQAALEALASCGQLGDDLTEQVDAIVELLANATTVETLLDGQTVTRSAAMGVRFELAGLLGGSASPETRERFLDRMTSLVADSQEPAINRIAAAGALFNLAAALDLTQRARVASVAAPLARGEAPQSPWDAGPPDPLSRFRISLPGTDELQAIGLELHGRLAGLGAADPREVRSSIASAIASGDPKLLAAALQAENWLPDARMPMPLQQLARHPEVRVRLAALVLWAHCYPDECVPAPTAAVLLADANVAVRSTLLQLAIERDDTETIAQLALDEHAYIRATVGRMSGSES